MTEIIRKMYTVALSLQFCLSSHRLLRFDTCPYDEKTFLHVPVSAEDRPARVACPTATFIGLAKNGVPLVATIQVSYDQGSLETFRDHSTCRDAQLL